ncbi:MAG: carbamoyltransferase [Candidatus Omnitrophica bacterium]|nr:carbamoyltransferase [Candidatus Omnitrophota bacterium]
MNILGINAYHPDSSAAIITDGKLIAACEEERFRRVKHFAGFPSESIKYCLKEAGISIKEVDCIAIPRDPSARLFRKVLYGIKIPVLIRKRIAAWGKTFAVKENLSELFGVHASVIRARIIKVEHHRAHLASSFFVSGFDKAFLLSMDALGDFASTMWGIGEGNKIRVLGETRFPHSLGFFYTAITQYLGFWNFGDEYKVMGLAAYGEPVFEDELKKILKIEKGSFKLGLSYFRHHKEFIDMSFDAGCPKIEQIFSPYLEKRLGKRRLPDEPIDTRHMDIARSLQKRLEDAVFHLLNFIEADTPNLCLSGGVAFNCAANGKIFENTRFEEVYCPAAAGDAGLASGAAYYVWNQMLDGPRAFVAGHACWGPEFSKYDIRCELERAVPGLNKERCAISNIEDNGKLCCETARLIAEGKIVGWFQGRMEWGPRALGNRSILADPRKPEMKDILNDRIKHRESFRPFAPSVLKECVAEYFERAHPSPFMSFAYKVRKEKRCLVPAVVHVDGSARLQTVDRSENSLYWKLINEFRNISGIPIVLNTSFNENEPIVCSPKEAINCFLRTKMDVLVMGNFMVQKNGQ